MLIRTLVCLPPALLVALALSGSETSFAQTKAEVSLTFQDLGPVLTPSTVGMSPDASVGAPSAAVLPDGRVRLYYNSEVGTDPQTAGFFSAISTDGVHFTPEPGERFHYTPQPLHVEHLPDGSWRLYYAENAPAPARGADGIASAISTDGLSFTGEPGLRLANPVSETRLSCCAIVRLADGRHRMYVESQLFVPGSPPGPPQIYSAVSSDLVNWTLEPGIRLNGRDPAALLTPDGSTMLVFSTGTGIETATSADGLTFANPTPTNLTSSDLHDLALATLTDGRLLMYYDTGDPTTTIGAAIATLVTAPSVSYPSPAATAITQTSARVSALVDPHGAFTRYAFEYGASTAYGAGTGLSDLPATTGQQTVSATLEGLSPSKTYHFRVNAISSVGSADGADQSFTTATCRVAFAHDRGWEVALAHAATQKAAAGLLRRGRSVVHGTRLVERDSCTDYETAIAGLTRQGSAAALRKAKKLGFRKPIVERT